MKLIRHILSHSVLIGFIALLVLGFYYRAMLFPAAWNERIAQETGRVAGPYAEKVLAFAAPQSLSATKIEALPAPATGSNADSKPAMDEQIAVPVVAPKVMVTVAEPNEPETEHQAAASVIEPNIEEQAAAPVVELGFGKQADTPVATTEVEEEPASPVATTEVEEEPAAPVATTEFEEEPASPVATTEVEEEPAAPVAAAEMEEEPAAPVAASEIEEEPAVPVATTEMEEEPAAPVAATEMEEEPAAPVVAAEIEEEHAAPLATTEVEEEPASPVAAAEVEDKTAVPATRAQAQDDDELIAQGTSDQDFIGINELWTKARKAYGQGDMEAAVQHYLALIKQESDNPDVFGELGNVYYSAGRFQQAGQAYYEAAIRLNELGRTDQVQYLVRVIEGLDPDSAAKLKQHLVR